MKIALSPRFVFFRRVFFAKVRHQCATVMSTRMRERYADIEDSAAGGRDISALNV